jgi:hypothetical protein
MVNRLLATGFLIVCMVAAAAAQSPFDGRWKINLSESQLPTAHYDYLLEDGIYHCFTCEPKVEIHADGLDHAVSGDPCYDTISVRIVDDRTTEETDKKDGKTVATTKISVSSDGETAIVESTEKCNAQGEAVESQDVISRLKNGPRGSHAISGSWKLTKRLNRSDNALIITLKLEEDTFSFSDPSDQKFTAKLDGTDTPFQGDLRGTVVSVKRAGGNTIVEANKRDGKITEIDRFTVSPDGKTLTISMEDKTDGSTRIFMAHKEQ